MDVRLTLRILGLLAMGFAATLSVPLLLSLYDGDGLVPIWLQSALTLGVIGAVMWLPGRTAQREMRLRDTYLIVTLVWMGLSFAAAYPFMTPIFGRGVVFDATPEQRKQAMRNQSLRDKFMRGHAEVIAAETERMLERLGPEGEIDLLDFFSELTIYTSSACLIGKQFREELTPEYFRVFYELEKGTDDLAYVSGWWWQTRNAKLWRLEPGDPDAEPSVAMEYSFEDRYNDPGHFTAMIGFEWSSLNTPEVPSNLHRVVIFKDDADKTSRVLPFSTFDSPDPEDQWQYMAGYEEMTGGSVLAIPHNGNLSNGLMFAVERFNGVKVERRRAGGRQRGSHTTGDLTGLAHASRHDASFERRQQLNGTHKRIVQTVTQRSHRIGLGANDSAGGVQHSITKTIRHSRLRAHGRSVQTTRGRRPRHRRA